LGSLHRIHETLGSADTEENGGRARWLKKQLANSTLYVDALIELLEKTEITRDTSGGGDASDVE
jgi:hypothetical protein